MPPDQPLEGKERKLIQDWKVKEFPIEEVKVDAAMVCAEEIEEKHIDASQPLTCDPSVTAPVGSRAWRLSSDQYTNAINDLFGNSLTGIKPISGDSQLGVIADSQPSLSISDQKYATILENAASVADQVLEKLKTNISSFNGLEFSCNDFSKATCRKEILNAMAKKAFRSAYSETVWDSIAGYYDDIASDGKLADAFTLTLELILQSPYFLYRLEIPASGSESLSNQQIVESLSFLLWNRPPSKDLLASIENKDLNGNREDLTALVNTMLDDVKSDGLLQRVLTPIFNLREVSKLNERMNISKTDVAALEEDIKVLLKSVLKGDESLSQLFLSRKTSSNAALEKFYGQLTQLGSDAEIKDTNRSGILTRAAILALMSHEGSISVFTRGALVRENVLCDALPPAPNLDAIPPVEEGKEATQANFRERFKAHRENPACISCHIKIDDIGFAMENFDTSGFFRDKYEDNSAIDPKGEISGTMDLDGSFNDFKELNEKIANSKQTSQCFSMHFFRFIYGDVINEKNHCELKAVTDNFDEKTSIKEYFVNALVSEYYRTRK